MNTCPIHQPPIHCPSCYFQRDGKCAHAKITKERDAYAKNLDAQQMQNSRDTLT